MNDWIHNTFFTNHPIAEKWFHSIIITFLLVIVYLIANYIFSKLGTVKQLKLSLFKSIVIGVAIPLIATFLWYNLHDNHPFDEYALITRSNTTTGYITNAIAHDEEVETNDSRTSGIKHSFTYDYTFYLPNGKSVNGYGIMEGTQLPDNMLDLVTKPYKVEVQYLPDNPDVSRVKDLLWHNKTVYEWFRYNVLIGVLILIVCSCIAFEIIRRGVKNYNLHKSTV